MSNTKYSLDSLLISTQTWSRDTRGLYDYDSKKTCKSSFKTSSSCYLVRLENIMRLSFDLNREPLVEGISFLGAISMREGNFTVSPVQEESLDRKFCEKLWLNVRSCKHSSKSKGYRLAEGDVLKLGKVKLRVKEINLLESIGSTFNLEEESEESEDSENEDASKSFRLPCRVCLRELYDDSNPLLSPCNCAGTMKYIHLRCLQRYLKSKITTNASDNIMSLEWTLLACDLCKKPFPYKLIVGNSEVNLIQIPKPSGRCIIFEILCTAKDSKRGLHLLHLKDKTNILLGRSNEAGFHISDISVSRNHAMIHYEDGAFYIEDKGSKFGTLVQVKRPVVVENQPLICQMGRTLVTFNLQRSWRFLPTCFRGDSNFDVFSAPIKEGVIPLYPLGTGVPVSVADPKHLVWSVDRQDYELENQNLLHQYNQLGLNSSFEDEPDDVQEIEIAEIPGDSLEISQSELTVQDDIKHHSLSHINH